MIRDLDALESRSFDLVIVGGGITGACVAHDAASRGLAVALVEKGDFGAATSAASSKLLHGGIRYLQQAQLGKVRESARERQIFLRIAPHLVRWVPFLIPTFGSFSKGRVLLGAGIQLYHLACLGTTRGLHDTSHPLPRDYFVPRTDLLEQHPVLRSLPGVTGAWVIHELHMRSSERMTLAFVKSAVEHGASVANYAEACTVRREGRHVTGITVRDVLDDRQLEIRARVVVNAAGPWTGAVNAAAGRVRLHRDITAFAKGVHLVTRRLSDVAVAVPTPYRSEALVQRGGRHFFVIPWRGRSLIGTTNVPFAGAPDEVCVQRRDIETFISDLNETLPAVHLTPADVHYAFAGLYPLTRPVIRPDVFQGTGVYQLVDHATSDDVQGLVSVLGAKFTTARRLAERAVNLVVRKLRVDAPACRTHTMPVAGGDISDLETFLHSATTRHEHHLPPEGVRHLVGYYGTEADAVIETGRRAPRGLERLAEHRPVVEAEIRHAVTREMACRLEDVVFRRTGMGTVGHPGTPCLERCAELMAETLGWNAARTAEEIQRVERRFEWR
jgi:glycerol-3-phosphate dehydrogenase